MIIPIGKYRHIEASTRIMYERLNEITNLHKFGFVRGMVFHDLLDFSGILSKYLH